MFFLQIYVMRLKWTEFESPITTSVGDVYRLRYLGKIQLHLYFFMFAVAARTAPGRSLRC